MLIEKGSLNKYESTKIDGGIKSETKTNKQRNLKIPLYFGIKQ